MLQALYDRTMRLSAHPQAMWILALVAFAESSFFPIPPDVMVIPMVLAARARAWRIAAVCTAASVIGGFAGYGIGAALFETVGRPVLEFYHAMDTFEQVQRHYNENGVLIVFSAGFSPIPYKVFTIASGVTGMDPWSFGLASAVSRGARFFLEAWLLWRYGAPIRAFIERHLAKLTLLFVILAAAGFLAVKYLF